MGRSQELRNSQYVITYGPGAILEGPNGPRIISSPNLGLFSNSVLSLTPEAVEISDQRMSHGLLNGARIFRLPSNAELGLSSGRYIYRTKPFPSNSLCLNLQRHNGFQGHAGNFAILYNRGSNCPVCRTGSRRQEAIRFVQACPNGHLDDINWNYLVHARTQCPTRDWFKWYGGGGSLAQVVVECPTCCSRISLGNAYSSPLHCRGRFPEQETPGLGSSFHTSTCNQQARIIQRQASNLKINNLQTLFTIPPRETFLHNLLQSSGILRVLRAILHVKPQQLDSKEGFADLFTPLVEAKEIPGPVYQEIMNLDWAEVRQAIDDVINPMGQGFRELLAEEFAALINASLHGAPATRGPLRKSPIVFEVDKEKVLNFTLENKRKFRVTPILRLRTVTVQTGYTREIRPVGSAGQTQLANEVSASFIDAKNQTWYPGAEFLGEGVFITLDDDGWHHPLGAELTKPWLDAMASSVDTYHERLFRSGDRHELHPVFVWWQSLSHLLIRAMAIDSGYSSTAIRERVYIEIDQASGRTRGGVILYATQPGSEGSLGGLIALVPYFDRILNRVFNIAKSCSNDPLCYEKKFRHGEICGSACYGCLLTSETSCEHRNLWLDRKFIANE